MIARRRDADSYERLRAGAEFKATMAKFAEKFTGPPSVSVNEILIEM